MDHRVEVPLHRSQNYELEDLSADYGSEVPGTQFVASVADQLVAVPLVRLFREHGLEVPADYRVYGDRFDLWIVPHRAAVIRKGGLREVTSLGLEVRYDNGKKTCSIAEVLPKAEFVDRASLQVRCSLGLNGKVSAGSPLSNSAEDAALQASIGASADGGVNSQLKFEARVRSANIQAIGVGGREATWVFELENKSLFGEDICTWTVLVLPKLPPGKKALLKCEVRMWITHRLAFVPTRWDGDPVMVSCEIPAAD